MKQKNRSCFFLTAFFSCLFLPIQSEVGNELGPSLYAVHFEDVPIIEFIRFVSKISKENFIFNGEDLNFNVSFSSGQPVPSENVVRALIRLLQIHRFQVAKEEGYYVVHKMRKTSSEEEGQVSEAPLAEDLFTARKVNRSSFALYKLQYHEGAEIVDSLKKMAGDLASQPGNSPQILNAIQTLQWVKTTNSLLFSGDEATVFDMNRIIASLDTPLRQVFIEILVIETDVRKGLDFGLQWAASGKYDNRLGGGFGNFAPNVPGGPNPNFSNVMQGINAVNTPTGLGQLPILPGFDLGVIGDIITHKGGSYLSLGSLVSALQLDADSTIVLNQKIITQDNKLSKIFVGDNIPFTGSVVTTVGQSQQTTANIEYRDVGVSLNITPMLGEGDVITLNLDEEITEAVYDHIPDQSMTVNGIRTTKTNMMTHVHVPDKHFLVLSGMIRNAKAIHKTGIPCLGGLPWVGALFSKTKKHDEKRNVIIFVRPQIIHSFAEYDRITRNQERLYESQGNAKDVSDGLHLLPPPD